jgi:hypothetical protein
MYSTSKIYFESTNLCPTYCHLARLSPCLCIVLLHLAPLPPLSSFLQFFFYSTSKEIFAKPPISDLLKPNLRISPYHTLDNMGCILYLFLPLPNTFSFPYTVWSHLFYFLKVLFSSISHEASVCPFFFFSQRPSSLSHKSRSFLS